MKWSSYFEFLTWLYSLGDKLPQVAQYLQVIIEALGGLANLFVPQPQALMGAAPVSDAEQRLEEKITKHMMQHGALPLTLEVAGGHKGLMLGAAAPGAWDGTILRQIFAFLQANPQLVAFLLSLLKIT